MNKTPINSTITPNYLNEYINYQESQNKSMNTINAYVKDIRMFFRHFNLSPSVVGREQIKEYKEHLQNVKNNNAKTINRSLSAIKSYNEFLIKEGWQENLVVLSMDYVKTQQSFSSPTNVSSKEVLNFMDKIKKNEPYRNYVIVYLIANTGLRVSEALNIKLVNLNTLKNGEITIIGKGNKQRNIIISNPKVINIINEYLTNHRGQYKYAVEVLNSPYLFVSNKGEKLEASSIERIFNKYSKKITPHCLRHNYATEALENDVLDLRQLQQQLGHARLDTVQIYTHPTKEKMKKKLSGFSIG
jgi:integrase/recombinase XerD